jgi:hypothetical protein
MRTRRTSAAEPEKKEGGHEDEEDLEALLTGPARRPLCPHFFLDCWLVFWAVVFFDAKNPRAIARPCLNGMRIRTREGGQR